MSHAEFMLKAKARSAAAAKSRARYAANPENAKAACVAYEARRVRPVCEHHKKLSQCWDCSPLGWAKYILRAQRSAAKIKNYSAPNMTPEELVELRRNNSASCVLCGGPLIWDGPRAPHLHHSHEGFGEVLGFTDSHCNNVEGMIFALPNPVIFLKNMLVYAEYRDEIANTHGSGDDSWRESKFPAS